ncbi:hypothetical protein [Chitinimonas sp.]|uniref:hypothetical protein n=1 Tax=Chitinimonas sp. TaxID=1934313 RepID=UPI002F940411
MQFDEVQAEHFSSLSRNPFPHVLIDRALIQLGGDHGGPYRNSVLAAAGWIHSNLTPFSKHPAEACNAFNRIRAVLAETEDPDAVLAALKKGG